MNALSDTHCQFDGDQVIHQIKHYLPAQAPLKDFVHHNTLHAFQDLEFFHALKKAHELFGYKVSLSLREFRELFASGKISEQLIERTIIQRKGQDQLSYWKDMLFNQEFEHSGPPRMGQLRAHWKACRAIDLDSMVHPILFRILCSYLDQGIAIWSFPVQENSLIGSLRKMELESASSIFKTSRARDLLLHTKCDLCELLDLLVGDELLYAQYLYDQQFAHPGWSGMVATIEDQPNTVLNGRNISLRDVIVLEVLLEIDALDYHSGKGWKPLSHSVSRRPGPLFSPVSFDERDEVLRIWQESLEWSYFDQVLGGIRISMEQPSLPHQGRRSFQALFCIDDREGSYRRYLEKNEPNCETFGTPGFFGVDTYYQPEGGKFYTKVCPVPIRPAHLIKEQEPVQKREKDIHFSKHSHSFYAGWLISQTLGFWAAFRLFLNLFTPTMSPATASSLKHMDKLAKLTVEHDGHDHSEDGLQVGYTVEEMVVRVEGTLRSIGLVSGFAPLIYVVGHGASSVNNPHYAAYDCGACSGRAGSVNARAFAVMANHAEVRKALEKRGVEIPEDTMFVGAIRDTTRDEIVFFDEEKLPGKLQQMHAQHEAVFRAASMENAKERSRRFGNVGLDEKPSAVHRKILRRSVSLFEPRPELNHATNSLCIVGRREMTRHVFLDRRAFLNSYDYRLDPDGKYLLNILNAAAPVCGGINLEYYFSRVDNQKLGAGTKLPHNVMGLIAVANGTDGDLRPGLPSQMIEVHDPLRLLMIVEHKPEVVLSAIRRNSSTYEWFANEWVLLAVIDPETREVFRFGKGEFHSYHTLSRDLPKVNDLSRFLSTSRENLPVVILN